MLHAALVSDDTALRQVDRHQIGALSVHQKIHEEKYSKPRRDRREFQQWDFCFQVQYRADNSERCLIELLAY